MSSGLGASSCNHVLWAGDESELWLPTLLHPRQWGRTMALWLMVHMKLDSKAELGLDPVVSLRQFSWRTAHGEQPPKYPSGGHRQFLRLLLLGLPDEKLKKIFLDSLFMSFFFTLFFYYDWTYASIRNDRRARGSFCFLDQSPEPYRFWTEVQEHLVSAWIWGAAVRSEPVFVNHRSLPGLSITTAWHFQLSLILNLALDRTMFLSAHLL